MKHIIRRIFNSISMYPNFMYFRQKIFFKSALESFASVSAHMRTALKSELFSVLRIGVIEKMYFLEKFNFL